MTTEKKRPSGKRPLDQRMENALKRLQKLYNEKTLHDQHVWSVRINRAVRWLDRLVETAPNETARERVKTVITQTRRLREGIEWPVTEVIKNGRLAIPEQPAKTPEQ